jgi:hypothetical protein
MNFFARGGSPSKDDPKIVLNNRVRLNLMTSFTGLQAHNFLGGVDGTINPLKVIV